ncbi:alpha/beta fold hydrolase [Mucilaginibacter polytrichastri]|uniref:AB hydrolase-1 domain-containing protein n=1 Tax=Mucilaginibacter polytrichastri TaxID=1302689 RepID=A0A1Q6A5B5_9SPHI|nr:alpha/beta hydrolase [Mucilaginibacter polytrichastri]OKS89198.1 hypothetical protein RG47T_4680 [Mucilaginibacter polytrichastri]SFS97891.1 Pimeloyl-ACP methyl ester carboxylesterase [Mucilaginibacter polytrichastri]
MTKILYLLLATLLSVSLFSCHNPAENIDKVEIENQGVNIAYNDKGKGDTVLLFVHGWCINKGYWANQLAYFSKKYRIITIDLPGFGQSGKNRSRWNARAFGGDVNAVMTKLNLKNVILIGHSMAGNIVVEAAVNDPKRVIALVGVDNFKSVGVGLPPTVKEKAAYDKAIDSLNHFFTAIATDYISHQLFSKTTPDSIKKRVMHDALSSDTSIAAACMKRDDLDETTELKNAGKTLYLINSDVNPTNVSGMQKLHMPFKLFYMHGTGHYPMIEKPVEFNNQLAQAIKSMHK